MKKIGRNDGFANRLKIIRRRVGISQTDLASSIGVTQAGVTNWETGRTEPDLFTVCKLANSLNCSTDELLGRSNTVTTGSITVKGAMVAPVGNNTEAKVGNTTINEGPSEPLLSALDTIRKQQETIAELTSVVRSLTAKQ